MKGISLVILSSLLLTSVSAQTDSTLKKNEIGLGVSNMLIGLLGGQEEGPTPLVITYKRLTHKNWALLSGFSYGNAHSSSGFFPAQVYDSLYIDQYETKEKETILLRLGAEHRYFFKPRLLFVVGLQLQGALIQEKRALYYWEGIRDDADNQPFTAKKEELTSLKSDRIDSKQMGLCVHAGIMTSLSKRFMLSAIWRPSLMISSSQVRGVNEQTGTISEYHSVYSEFTSGPLVSEVSIFYRF